MFDFSSAFDILQKAQAIDIRLCFLFLLLSDFLAATLSDPCGQRLLPVTAFLPPLPPASFIIPQSLRNRTFPGQLLIRQQRRCRTDQ